jgi:hypothetical protein
MSRTEFLRELERAYDIQAAGVARGN